MKKKEIILTICIMVLSIAAYAQNYGIKPNTLSGMLISNSDTKFTLIDQSLLNIFGDYNPLNLADTYDNNKTTHWLCNAKCNWWSFKSFNSHLFVKRVLSRQHNIGGYGISWFFNEKILDDVCIDKMEINYFLIWNKLWGTKFDIENGDVYIEESDS